MNQGIEFFLKKSDLSFLKNGISCFWSTRTATSVSVPSSSSNSNPKFGLRNKGNTCFMNALFQCLYQVVPFREKIIEINNGSNFPLISKKSSIYSFWLLKYRKSSWTFSADEEPKRRWRFKPTWSRAYKLDLCNSQSKRRSKSLRRGKPKFFL